MFACGEYSLALRLVSKLPDLRAPNANLQLLQSNNQDQIGHQGQKKRDRFAQLLIRKLGSFIRLRRVLLLRSDIRLATSGIRYASLGGE